MLLKDSFGDLFILVDRSDLTWNTLPASYVCARRKGARVCAIGGRGVSSAGRVMALYDRTRRVCELDRTSKRARSNHSALFPRDTYDSPSPLYR